MLRVAACLELVFNHVVVESRDLLVCEEIEIRKRCVGIRFRLCRAVTVQLINYHIVVFLFTGLNNRNVGFFICH